MSSAMQKPSRPGKMGRDNQVIQLLNQLGTRLVRSEKERRAMQNMLAEHKEMFADMEDRAMLGEKAYIGLQNQIAKRESAERALLIRQQKMEKELQDKFEKIEKAAALADKIEEAIAQQARLNRRLDKIHQDKTRMIRKLDQIEEVVAETQETVRSGALVTMDDAGKDKSDDAPWWQRSFHVQAIGMAATILVAGIVGWSASSLQQSMTTRGAASSTVAAAETAESNPAADYADNREAPDENGLIIPAFSTVGAYENPETMSAEELLAAMAEDPDALAAKLNAIEPEAAPAVVPEEPQEIANQGTGENDAIELAALTPQDKVETAPPPPPPVQQAVKPPTPPARDADIEKFIADQKSDTPVRQRIAEDKNLPAVIKEIEAKALDGVPEAQHDLAAIYTAGHGGVAVDYKKAAQWFREAAIAGVGNARYNLGVLYHQGLGVDRNVDEAIRWYRAAAALGHPEAQYNLGIAHIEGIGADYNPQVAARFFEQAAQSGIMEAAYNLGLIYENGLLGTPQPQEAMRWYQKAAEQGSPEAQMALDQLSKANKPPVDLRSGAAVAPQTRKTAAAPPEAENIDPEILDGLHIPRKLSSADMSAAPEVSNKERAVVAQIQEQLERFGLYPGPADGIMGPRTEDAIRSYQASYNLTQDGRASEALLVHMLTSELDAAMGDVGSREE
ncbi:MAG: SEL1-like repeat protein [Rhodospirillales bacterium]|nr:SEL1-like repeat protein [Rhodospirillales bacterium]